MTAEEQAAADGGTEGGDIIPRSDHSVPIHSLIESSQSSHGLRHSDYDQYQSYCTRRLSRLRHAKGVRKELSHGGKTGGQQKKGGRHAFQPRSFDPADSNAHVNYVLVSLYQAERAWSHSMEIKALYDAAREEAKSSSSSKKKKIGGGAANVDLGDKKRSAPSKIRSHQLRRLRKAASFASELEERAAASCDAASALEANAYASWMRGNLALETGDWAAGAREYGAAIRMCGELEAGGGGGEGDENGGGTEKKEELERRDYFHGRAEHVIEPLLRYCRYEMQEGGMDQTDILALKDADQSLQLKSKIESLRAERLRTQASGGGMSTVRFRGRDVPVENETLRVALLEAADLKADLDKQSSEAEEGDDAKFLSLLSGYDDAAAVASDDLAEYAGMKAGPAVNARRRDAELLVGYVKYQKLRLLMRRNERMVEELRAKERAAGKDGSEADDAKRAEEIAHLYDALLQDARAVASLPGGGDDGEAGGDGEEDEFALEADADVLRVRALRSYYVAKLYASPSVGKHAEAAALLRLARSLAGRAAEEIAACQDMEDGDARAKAMEELGGAIEAETCRAAAGAFLAKRCGGGGAASSSSSTRGAVGGGSGFLRRLDDLDASAMACGGDPPTRLADVPPLPEPIPCRPTFFDVALNHVGEFPAEELAAHIDAHQEKKGSGGLLGWFSRG